MITDQISNLKQPVMKKIFQSAWLPRRRMQMVFTKHGMKRHLMLILIATAALVLSSSPGSAQSPVNGVMITPFKNHAGGKYSKAGQEAVGAITAMLTKENICQVVTDAKKGSAAVYVHGTYILKDGKLDFNISFTDGRTKKELGAFGPVICTPGDYTTLAEKTASVLDNWQRGGTYAFGWPPPSSWAIHMETRKAWDVFNKSDWAGALERFEKINKLDPDYINAMYGIWVSNGNMGRTLPRDSMKVVLKPLMTKKPGLMNDVYTWLNAAHTRDFETMYQTGKHLAADYDRFEYSAALPANHTGRYEEVIALYKKRDTSANTRDWRPWDYNVMFALHSLGRYDESIALGRDIEKLRGFDYYSANLQLYPLAATGRFDEVENLLARINLLKPGTVTYGNSLAIVGWEYLAHGYPQQAKDIFRRRVAWYKALEPDQQKTYALAMANAEFVAGNLAESRARYEAYLRDNPDNLSGWSGLGWVAIETGDDALFRKIDDRLSSEQRPSMKSEALYYRGYLYAGKGDCATAEKLFREGLASGISKWDYGIHTGNAYGKVKNCTVLQELLGPRK